MSTGRHWGRILLPAPMGQSPAQHDAATPPCAICLTPPGLASERQPPAAVHLACFQRPGQYPLSKCVNNRSQDLLVCIPAQSRRLTQCTTCCRLAPLLRWYTLFKTLPCSSSSYWAEVSCCLGLADRAWNNRSAKNTENNHKSLAFAMCQGTTPACVVTSNSMHPRQASMSIKIALPGRTRVVHSPSHPTRACPAQSNQYTASN